jgi:nitronate monooxygenase
MWMRIETRLTQALGIKHPIVLAPMGTASGGALASAVTNAGGLGFIGGGYGDARWIEEQFREAGNTRVGGGFITWSLAQAPQLLDVMLAHKPAAMFLSFGDPRPFAPAIKASGALLFCQVQSREDCIEALEAGADIIVAQGTEAGGHGAQRATLTLVPEIADLLAREAPETLLCAAGGIADGRGLAAALALGADGVVVGTRFWAAAEALVHPNVQAAGVNASGDDTLRTSSTDIVRERYWPDRFNIRVVRNDFTNRWHGKENELRANRAPETERVFAAIASGDSSFAPIIAGEALGLIEAVEPAETIVSRMIEEAADILRSTARQVR